MVKVASRYIYAFWRQSRVAVKKDRAFSADYENKLRKAIELWGKQD
jgi:hypothetical protein